MSSSEVIVQRMGAFVLIVFVSLGFKLYRKSNTETDVKANLTAACEADASCQQAVETFFEGCFDQSYKLKSRTSSHFSAEQFAGCINQSSGKKWFAVSSDSTSDKAGGL